MIKVLQLQIFCLLLGALAISTIAQAAPSDFLLCKEPSENPVLVLNQLVKTSQRLSDGFSAKLIISNSSYPSASILKDEITLSQGLLHLASADSEIAFVLAHEIGHSLLGHEHTSMLLGSGQAVQDEKEADRLALALLQASGYDPGASTLILGRIADKLAEHSPGLAKELEVRASQLRNYL